MIPDTELLLASNVIPAWVTVTFGVTRFLGLGEQTAAKASAREVYTMAVERGVSALPIAQPTLSGATFVIDFRIQRSLTAGSLRRQLTEKFDVDVLAIGRLNRVDLQQATAPQRREDLVVESERARQSARRDLRGLLGISTNVFKAVRGVAILVIVGVGLLLAAPFLRQGAVALKFLQKTRRAT